MLLVLLLVYSVGKNLNKAETMSSWNSRPLTASQLHYAALDAHVLLAMLGRVLGLLQEKEGEEEGINQQKTSNNNNNNNNVVTDMNELNLLSQVYGMYRVQVQLQSNNNNRSNCISSSSSNCISNCSSNSSSNGITLNNWKLKFLKNFHS